jgi:hypothetical protein
MTKPKEESWEDELREYIGIFRSSQGIKAMEVFISKTIKKEGEKAYRKGQLKGLERVRTYGHPVGQTEELVKRSEVIELIKKSKL